MPVRLRHLIAAASTAVLVGALVVGTLNGGNNKTSGNPVVTIEPRSAPLGSLLSIEGRGLPKDGTLREKAWVPIQFEVRRSDPAAPKEALPAAPGVYEFAIDTPDNRIPGATFELVPAKIGVRYPRVLSTHCGIETLAFDGSVWLADPPLNDGQGNPPPGWGNPGIDGTFTLTAPDQAVFRGSGGQTVRFRRAPADSGVEPRICY